MKKFKIKILVCYHKKDKLFKNDVLVPVHCGRALACEASKDGKMSEQDYQWMLDNMIGDDTDDNISELNRDINEWSAIYWAWKNYDKLGNPDYIGLCHYRRLFDFSDVIKTTNYSLLNRLGLNKKDLNKLLSKYDFVYREGFKVHDNTQHTFDYYQPNVNLSENYHSILYKQFQKFENEQVFYAGNMFIMKKDDFFNYCENVFPLMFDFLNKPKDEVNQKFLNAVKLKMAPERYQKLKEKSDKNNNWYPRMTGYMMEYISSFYFMHLMDIYKNKALSGHIYTPTNERRSKLLDTIFSVKNQTINSQKYKIVTIAGLKFKHKLSSTTSSNTINLNDYNNAYSGYLDPIKISSGNEIIKIIKQYYTPKSVIDIGCGKGMFLKCWKDSGVETIAGIDGNTLDNKDLFIDRKFIQIANLETYENVNNTKYDLAMSLEVAEHLHPENAAHFVKLLTGYSDFILFSAAIPYQAGLHHINCQPLKYWVDLFNKENFVCFDFIRPQLFANHEKVKSFYIQNILFFVNKERANQLTQFNLSPTTNPLMFYHADRVNILMGKEK